MFMVRGSTLSFGYGKTTQTTCEGCGRKSRDPFDLKLTSCCSSAAAHPANASVAGMLRKHTKKDRDCLRRREMKEISTFECEVSWRKCLCINSVTLMINFLKILRNLKVKITIFCLNKTLSCTADFCFTGESWKKHLFIYLFIFKNVDDWIYSRIRFTKFSLRPTSETK